MSRKPVPIKIVNLEDGMPKVEAARLRMQHEIHAARKQGYTAVKLIHGYGSSGAGGSLRIELQKELRRLAEGGKIRAFVAGEDWRGFPHARRGPRPAPSRIEHRRPSP